jgi:PST family polysaccharide transporter
MLARLRRDPLLLNLAALYVSLGANAVLTLGTMAYLARTLGPETWGLFLLAQAFGYWASIVPDFGFNLSGARSVARCETPDEVIRIINSVNLSKLLLSLLLIPVIVAAYLIIPAFRDQPIYLIGGLFFAFAQGMDPIWLFLGTERQYLYSSKDLQMAGWRCSFRPRDRQRSSWSRLPTFCGFSRGDELACPM